MKHHSCSRHPHKIHFRTLRYVIEFIIISIIIISISFITMVATTAISMLGSIVATAASSPMMVAMIGTAAGMYWRNPHVVLGALAAALILKAMQVVYHILTSACTMIRHTMTGVVAAVSPIVKAVSPIANRMTTAVLEMIVPMVRRTGTGAASLYKGASQGCLEALRVVMEGLFFLVGIATVVLGVGIPVALIVQIGCPSLDVLVPAVAHAVLPCIFSEWTLTWGLATMAFYVVFGGNRSSNPHVAPMGILTVAMLHILDFEHAAAFVMHVAGNMMAFALVVTTARQVLTTLVRVGGWTFRKVLGGGIKKKQPSTSPFTFATATATTTSSVDVEVDYYIEEPNNTEVEIDEYSDEFCQLTHQPYKTQGCDCDFCYWAEDTTKATRRRRSRHNKSAFQPVPKRVVVMPITANEEEENFCMMTGQDEKTIACGCDYCLWL